MKKMKMQLFGHFQLESDNKVLGEEEIRSNKLTRLLVYLLLNRERMLTHRQLIEVFWEDESRNPEGALKNLICRIRNELKVLGDDKFVCTLPNAYRWNENIEVETDYEQFEQLISDLHRPGNDDQTMERQCREIIDCYKGNVSTKVRDESWILPKVVWYQARYMETVKTLCAILERKGRWAEIETICNTALNEDLLDEDIHCFLIRSLNGQKKYDRALAQYEKAKKMFYEQMGVHEPEKICKTFREMMTDTGQDIVSIREVLEMTRETDKPQGAFFCDYQIFRQIYRVEMRRIERFGIAEFMMLLTLRIDKDSKSQSNMEQKLIEGMNVLEEVVRDSLRIGDVATRCSPTQIIVLLPTCTYEAGNKVARRIEKKFKGKSPHRGLELLYELAECSSFA